MISSEIGPMPGLTKSDEVIHRVPGSKLEMGEHRK